MVEVLLIEPAHGIQPEQVIDAATIHDMMQRFERTGTDVSGWITDYRDPRSGATWQLTYPQGEMHGGGPPLLTRTG